MALKDIIPGRICFGSAPFGNMFRDIPEADKPRLPPPGTAGSDSAVLPPFYGAGLAELWLGKALPGKDRGSYGISTKVGGVILDEVEDVSARDQGERGEVFKYRRPDQIVNGYSHDGRLRSIENSLERPGTDHIDIAFVHDVAQDWLRPVVGIRDGPQGRLQGAGPGRATKA